MKYVWILIASLIFPMAFVKMVKGEKIAATWQNTAETWERTAGIAGKRADMCSQKAISVTAEFDKSVTSNQQKREELRLLKEEIPRIQEERDTAYKLVRGLKVSNDNKRRRIDSQHTRLEWHSDPQSGITRRQGNAEMTTDTENYPPLTSIAKTQSMLGDRGRATINRLLVSGNLESVKSGRRRLIVTSSILAYVERLKAAGAGEPSATD